MSNNPIIKAGKQIISCEIRSLELLLAKIGPSFAQAVHLLASCSSNILISGSGQSFLIAKKLASTLVCGGLPAIPLDATHGPHGWAGLIHQGNMLVCISNSGYSGETVWIAQIGRKKGAQIIAICGDGQSPLAQQAHIWLDIGQHEECGHLGLIATSSSTASLVLADALAMVILSQLGISKEVIVENHPGGGIGRLYNTQEP